MRLCCFEDIIHFPWGCSYHAVLDIQVFLVHLWQTWLWSHHLWISIGHQMELQAFLFRRSSRVQAEDRCSDNRWYHMDTLCKLYSASEVRWHCPFWGYLRWESYVARYLPKRCLYQFGYVKAFLDMPLSCHLGVLIDGLGLTLSTMLALLERIQWSFIFLSSVWMFT